MSTMEGQNPDKTSSLLHGSKSESNLFSFHKSGVAMDTTSNLNAATSMQTMPNNNNDLEDMVTSTPAPTAQGGFKYPKSARK